MENLVFVLSNGAVAPRRAYDGDVGYDLFPKKDFGHAFIFSRKNELINTGVRVIFPDGWFGKIESRSSLAKRGLIATGGIIDPGYQGEIHIILQNLNTSGAVLIGQGDAVAQLVLYPIYAGPVEVTYFFPPDLAKTKRGERGFGSSGRSGVKEPD